MIGILIVTHGEIGTSMLSSASQILGGAQQQVATLSVWRHDDPDDLVLRARQLLEQIDAGEGVLVLTDIYGATPANIACRLLKPGRVEGVAGVNLPMLIRALTYRNEPLASVLDKAVSGATEGVTRMGAPGECR